MSEGTQLPKLVTSVPGPKSVDLVDVLARHESPGVTARRARQGEARGVSSDPIVWARSRGANVWDEDGNRYVDLCAGFGVAAIGHGHPKVVEAVHAQSSALLHSMGDVYPNSPRIRLMERIAALAPGDLSQCILGLNGSDSVEAALKTAALYTGKPGVLAFWGAYHGLSYGALAATAYKDGFRRPFTAQLGGHVRHLPYGAELAMIDAFIAGPATGGESIGTILVEPIQGRGGEVVPPEGWLRGLREISDRHGLALVFDEIYTGLGRTGRWWAGDHDDVVPDIMAIGKALGGGMPLSACVARPDVMAAWTMQGGEAIHTATFLGHPVSAAAGLAALEVLEAIDAPRAARRIEATCRARFPDRIRGRGAMLGFETGSPGEGARIAGELLKSGWITLPGGIHGDILGITPPFVISDAQLEGALDAIEAAATS